MPLNIELKPHEKIFINGAVIVNGPDRAHISLLNEAAILREKDILTEEKSDSPCKKIYLAVQLRYMDPDDALRYQALYDRLSLEVLHAAPSTAALIDTITADLAKGRTYAALKTARKLVDYEQELLNHARQSS